jgi:hypothetical protein
MTGDYINGFTTGAFFVLAVIAWAAALGVI